MCFAVLPTCLSVYYLSVVGGSGGQKREGIRSPGTRVVDGCELHVGAGIQLH